MNKVYALLIKQGVKHREKLIPLLIGFLCLLIPNAFIPMYTPDITDEQFSFYKEQSELLGVDWKEILTRDVVRFDNEFENVDIMASIIDFMKLDIKEYEEVEKTEYVRDSSGHIVYEKKYDSDGNYKGKKAKKRTYKVWELMSEYSKSGTTASGFLSSNSVDLTSMRTILDGISQVDGTNRYDVSLDALSIDDFLDQFNDDGKNDIALYLDEGLMSDLMEDTKAYSLPASIVIDSRGFFTNPAPSCNLITSPFGYRWHPIKKKQIFHDGVDISKTGGSMGQPVGAAAGGVVVHVKRQNTGYGNNIIIEHTDDDGRVWRTRYAHLLSVRVSMYDEVDKGQTIGAVGNTGDSTGAHLHFEMKVLNDDQGFVLIDPTSIIDF